MLKLKTHFKMDVEKSDKSLSRRSEQYREPLDTRSAKSSARINTQQEMPTEDLTKIDND